MVQYQPKDWNNRTPYGFALKRCLLFDELADRDCNQANEERYYRILDLQEKYFFRFSTPEVLELFRGMILDSRCRKSVDPDGAIFTKELEDEVLNDSEMALHIMEFIKEQRS